MTTKQGSNTMRYRKVLIVFAILALALAACGGSSDGDTDTTATTTASGGDSGDIAAGSAVYAGTCVACHGTNLEGIDGLGKPLAPSEFVASNSEQELADFIKVGRPAGDPDNTQGVDMPPKGGNPSLDDQDLLDVAAYLKSLN